mgnify:CR=1 FL=1
MTIDEVLHLIHVAGNTKLTPIQEQLLRQSWEGRSYAEIAAMSYYEEPYLRNIASHLWQILSHLFNIPIQKANFRTTLEPLIWSRELPPPPEFSLEVPSGPVPLGSPFYIERPPIEELCYATIRHPGSVIRIKAPKKTGKSSLMMRILGQAKQTGYHTVILDFQQIEDSICESLDKFLRWFCANVGRQLNLNPALDQYWDEDIGSKVSCTLYLQYHILENLDHPLVLALNEVNILFQYLSLAQEFLPLLRSWHEEAKQVSTLQKLRLIVVHSTEVYIPLNLHQSPFNVGLPIRLPEFTLEQVQELAKRHRLNWQRTQKAKKLMAMVGGHPYLIRMALYYLCQEGADFEQLLETAPTLSGIYSEHLRCHWMMIKSHEDLTLTMKKLTNSDESLPIESMAAYQLDSMGLIHLEGNQVKISCELYRLYFQTQFLEQNSAN